MTAEERAANLFNSECTHHDGDGFNEFFVAVDCDKCVAAAIAAAERALLERLVPEVCFYACAALEDPPVRVIGHCGTPDPGNDWAWWFHAPEDGGATTDGVECPASPLHELLKEMDDA